MVDVCVIGGGPAGIFSAYYAASRGMRVLLLEADEKLGGRLHHFWHMPMYDLPAQFGITAKQYCTELIAQLAKSPATVQCNAFVSHVTYDDDGYTVHCTDATYTAKTIIQATGNGFLRPRQLNYDAPIHYALCEPFPQQARIAVIGHTPTAADWALQLAANNDVTFFYTKPLTLQPMLREPLLQLRVKPFSQLAQEEPFEYMYGHIGSHTKTLKRPFHTLAAPHAGYFTAGDVHQMDGKLKLIHGATHDAMQAVNAAYQFLHADATYQPIVSTHHPIFKEWNT